MAAEDHLNEVQFSDPHELAAKYWDPNMKNPETLRRWAGEGYIQNLASQIKERGFDHPVQVSRRTGVFYDGHHRTLAAMDLGVEVPWKWVSGIPGEQ